MPEEPMETEGARIAEVWVFLSSGGCTLHVLLGG